MAAGGVAAGLRDAPPDGTAPGLRSARQNPARTIRIVVPFAAGGLGDVVARIVAEPLSQRLGPPIAVGNRFRARTTADAAALLRRDAERDAALIREAGLRCEAAGGAVASTPGAWHPATVSAGRAAWAGV